MKILITSGTYPPKIGGSAYYATNLEKEFERQGHEVEVLSYGVENKLPIGIRHIWFFFRVLFILPGNDFLLALDTFSVGVPSVWATKLLGVKSIIRIGGDFLWESYVNRTGDQMPFPEFYRNIPQLSKKEQLIFFFMKNNLKKYDAIVFNTEWQKDIFKKYYNLGEHIYVVWNYLSEKISPSQAFVGKKFVSVGRDIPLKNQTVLRKVLKDIQSSNSNVSYVIGEMSFKEMLKEVEEAYALVLPSVSDMSPGFIFEGIKMNKPFIVTKHTGLPDDIKKLGLLVNPFDENDIKTKIEFLLDDNNYSEYKGRVERFNRTHSWEEVAKEFLNIYSKIS